MELSRPAVRQQPRKENLNSRLVRTLEAKGQMHRLPKR